MGDGGGGVRREQPKIIISYQNFIKELPPSARNIINCQIRRGTPVRILRTASGRGRQRRNNSNKRPIVLNTLRGVEFACVRREDDDKLHYLNTKIIYCHSTRRVPVMGCKISELLVFNCRYNPRCDMPRVGVICNLYVEWVCDDKEATSREWRSSLGFRKERMGRWRVDFFTSLPEIVVKSLNFMEFAF